MKKLRQITIEAILYPDTPKKGVGYTDYHDQDANAHWNKHYGNLLHFSRVHARASSFTQRLQAEKEIGTARQKLAHWQKHPNFNVHLAAKHAAIMKRESQAATPTSSTLIKKGSPEHYQMTQKKDTREVSQARHGHDSVSRVAR